LFEVLEEGDNLICNLMMVFTEKTNTSFKQNYLC